MFTKRQVSLKGFAEDKFEPVREAFQENFTNGDEVSAQVCVVQAGKVVVDLWCSGEDQDYTGDTLQQIWSSTKNLTALAVAMLVDRLVTLLLSVMMKIVGLEMFSTTQTRSVNTGLSLVSTASRTSP